MAGPRSRSRSTGCRPRRGRRSKRSGPPCWRSHHLQPTASGAPRRQGRRPSAHRVVDGRDGHLARLVAAAIGRAKAAARPLAQRDLIAEVWAEFSRTADLSRPKGKGGGLWSIRDVERKVAYALRPSRSGRVNAARAKSTWPLSRKLALKAIMDKDDRLAGADRTVAWAMLEAVRDERGLCYLASTTIARQTGLHEVSVRASRSRLIALGYFAKVRSGGRGRPTVCAPNARLVDAVPTSTASAILRDDRFSGVFANPEAANDPRSSQTTEPARENTDFVASQATAIPLPGGSRGKGERRPVRSRSRPARLRSVGT